jgi:hypothetical protein
MRGGEDLRILFPPGGVTFKLFLLAPELLLRGMLS